MNRHHGNMRKMSYTLIVGLALAPASLAQGQVRPARAEQSQLDMPLSWLYDAKRNFTGVKDYSCTLISQERVRGELREQNVIQLKMKNQPHSVYMKWLAPRKDAGQEVVFVSGRNNNKMRVRSNFIGKNLIGFVSVDPGDPRVLEHSRHTILEAGIGNMIEQSIRDWSMDRDIGKSVVRISEVPFDRRDCHRIEVIRTERHPNLHYRTVMFLEKQAKLPIRVENYDWPRQGGPQEGELLESFSYANLQFNTGLRDEEFNK